MKLLECYIENFGKLSSYRKVFSDGLNVINENNGYGKTTLSVFIKSMLYGIDANKIRGEESERKRYSPWQGGRFGGSLTFESEGKRYRIERTFGEKASGDSFSVYDTESGAVCKELDENLGERLFGIDADGFERTVFLSERKLNVNGNNQTIAAKLSNLVGVDGDMGSFDKALEKLEKKEKQYQHRRGGGGAIGDIKNEISRLDAEIMALSAKKNDCREAETRLTDLTERSNALAKRKNELEAGKLSREYEKEYTKKRDSLLECEKEISAKKAFFGGNPPSREEVRINEKKKSESLLLLESVSSKKELLSRPLNDHSEKLNEFISALATPKKEENANKSYLLSSFFAIFAAIIALALGILLHPACYLISVFSLPFVYLGVVKFKDRCKATNDLDAILSSARLFILEEKGLNPTDEEIYPCLCNMKAEIFAKKAEIERMRESLALSEKRINELTEEYVAFLSKLSLDKDASFDEIGIQLSSYESLLSLREKLLLECEKYAREHGIDPNIPTAFDETDITSLLESINAEIRAIRSDKFTAEALVSSLYEEISREDELAEKRLELTDALESARGTHRMILKAAEHLAAAKERLTAKYLGRMRSSFDKYIDEISSEKDAKFTIDTDFSLKKTEGGLTNKIEGYSLGMRELYSLIARFALVDALYEKEEPFIILDDPFCHLDDIKCRSSLNALIGLSDKKQIIYLTCSSTRTPI